MRAFIPIASPCKDCKERTVTPNCHNTCEKYLSWKKKLHEISEAEKLQSFLDSRQKKH